MKPFYGSRASSDTKKFNESIDNLTKLYSGIKGGKKLLASELGISTSTLNRWAKGKAKPKDMDVFNKVNKKSSSLKNTLKDENKIEKFKVKKKKEIEQIKLSIPRIITESVETWLDRLFQQRYKNILKWDYFRNMLRSNGYHWVKYLSNNTYEGMILKTPDEYIIGKTFLQMVGISMQYPYNDENRQLFIRRAIRTATMINDNPLDSQTEEAVKTFEQNTTRARIIFYSGDDVKNKIENFIGYFFDVSTASRG